MFRHVGDMRAASISAIQRGLIKLEEQGGNQFLMRLSSNKYLVKLNIILFYSVENGVFSYLIDDLMSIEVTLTYSFIFETTKKLTSSVG